MYPGIPRIGATCTPLSVCLSYLPPFSQTNQGLTPQQRHRIGISAKGHGGPNPTTGGDHGQLLLLRWVYTAHTKTRSGHSWRKDKPQPKPYYRCARKDKRGRSVRFPRETRSGSDRALPPAIDGRAPQVPPKGPLRARAQFRLEGTKSTRNK